LGGIQVVEQWNEFFFEYFAEYLVRGRIVQYQGDCGWRVTAGFSKLSDSQHIRIMVRLSLVSDSLLIAPQKALELIIGGGSDAANQQGIKSVSFSDNCPEEIAIVGHAGQSLIIRHTVIAINLPPICRLRLPFDRSASPRRAKKSLTMTNDNDTPVQ